MKANSQLPIDEGTAWGNNFGVMPGIESGATATPEMLYGVPTAITAQTNNDTFVLMNEPGNFVVTMNPTEAWGGPHGKHGGTPVMN